MRGGKERGVFPEDAQGSTLFGEEDQKSLCFFLKGLEDSLQGLLKSAFAAFRELSYHAGEKGTKAVEVAQAPVGDVIHFGRGGVSGELKGVESVLSWRRSVGNSGENAPPAAFFRCHLPEGSEDRPFRVVPGKDEVGIPTSELEEKDEFSFLLPQGGVVNEYLNHPVPPSLGEGEDFSSHEVLVEELLPGSLWGFPFFGGGAESKDAELWMGTYKEPSRPPGCGKVDADFPVAGKGYPLDFPSNCGSFDLLNESPQGKTF